jgi:sigma-E factor negative regulatory protein RseA
MKERLSALMDGELQGEEFLSQLGRLQSDPGLRSTWDTYHLIGDALRGHVCPAIVTGVVARLKQEPTVLAPRRHPAGFGRLARYAMSAAAGIAAIALVSWTAAPLWRGAPQIAASPAPAEVKQAAAAEPRATVTAAEVENYLLAHQPYSQTSMLQGIAPYVRTVADEGQVSQR